MKTIVFILTILVLNCGVCNPVHAQAAEVEQLLLNVEKLAQLKQILADIKKGIQITTNGYNTVKNIAEGNFNLHQLFLDKLLQISPTVKNYYKVVEIIQMEITLIKSTKKSFKEFDYSSMLRMGETNYVERVYQNLLNKSLENLDDLTQVLTATALRMSDEERLARIDEIHASMKEKSTFLQQFNSQVSGLIFQRKSEKTQIDLLKKV
jgi:hypothetical protein